MIIPERMPADSSDFRIGDYLYSNHIALKTGSDAPYDFITFLAVAQKLQIEFLPLTWQPALEHIGRGGTSQITQALINLQTSFAFKRVQEWKGRDENELFQILIREIMLLRYPCVRNHPYIAELQGICWDVPREFPIELEAAEAADFQHTGKIWPVLVFEKSHYGDLSFFARSPMGRDLGFDERLKLCLHIGDALAVMHPNGDLSWVVSAFLS